jgi:putative membrane protein
LFIVFLSILASYLNLVQRYYHFTLEENENTLIATRGLFKRTTVSVRRTRIQAARLRQSIIRQALHLTTVQALVASNASDDEKDNDLVLMPVVATAQTWTMMHPFLPWLPAMPPTFTPIPRSSHWYYIRNIVSGNGLIIGLALVGLGYFARQWLWLGTIVAGSWLLFVALQGRYAAKQAGVAIIDDHRLAIQTGSWWTRTQYVVRRENIQACAVTTSLWLVPKHRCHVTLNLRSGDSNQKVTVRYLDTTAARAIRDWFRPADTGQHF